jgi:hypothetical protein
VEEVFYCFTYVEQIKILILSIDISIN